MIGTDFETITLLHLAEYLAAVPYEGYSHYFGTSDQNKPVVRLRTTGASGAFVKFTGLLNSGALQARTVRLGNSHVTVIHARELVDFAAQILRYLPDFVLGSRRPVVGSGVICSPRNPRCLTNDRETVGARLSVLRSIFSRLICQGIECVSERMSAG